MPARLSRHRRLCRGQCPRLALNHRAPRGLYLVGEAVEQKQASGAAAFEQGPQTPEAALIAKADARRLEAAIAELPVPFRETLVLRDVQGLDYREIAEVTKVPIGTVMSRLARARRRLMERIGTDAPWGGA